MALLIRFLVLALGLGVGIGLIKYNYQLTRLFGYNTYAEKYLGEAGTYSMWKLLGILAIVGSFIYAFR